MRISLDDELSTIVQELAEDFDRSPHQVLNDGVNALISDWIYIDPMLERLINEQIQRFTSEQVWVKTNTDRPDQPEVQSLFQRQGNELVFVKYVPADMQDMVPDEELNFVTELVNDWYHRCDGREQMECANSRLH